MDPAFPWTKAPIPGLGWQHTVLCKKLSTQPRPRFIRVVCTREKRAAAYIRRKLLAKMVHGWVRGLTGPNDDIRELKQRRFWATHVNRKWAFFSFNIPWRYQICIAKYLYSYWDELPENSEKLLLSNAKRPLPVDVRRSKRPCLSSLEFVWVPRVICNNGSKISIHFLKEFNIWSEHFPVVFLTFSLDYVRIL